MPEKECPARTAGPFCRSSTRLADATASGNVVRGFCTEVTLRPADCKRGITSDQLEPSANSPCTSTTLRALTRADGAPAVRVEIEYAAAPPRRAREKSRLLTFGMKDSRADH